MKQQSLFLLLQGKNISYFFELTYIVSKFVCILHLINNAMRESHFSSKFVFGFNLKHFIFIQLA